jgi:hypothetical protein
MNVIFANAVFKRGELESGGTTGMGKGGFRSNRRSGFNRVNLNRGDFLRFLCNDGLL